METLKRSIFSFTIADLVSKGILYFLVTPVGTGHKLNVHKTFRRRPGRLLIIFSMFNLHPVFFYFMLEIIK